MGIVKYKKEMTNNEYMEYCRFLANNVSKGLLTYKKYSEILDGIKILPFNLSKYTKLSEDTKNNVNRLFTENYISNDKEIFKGFIEHEKTYKISKILNCDSLAGHYYSEAYCNDKELFFFSACEGDIYFKAFNTFERYEQEKASIIEFYENN